ncbi:MAG: TPM domain-containing protein [Hyphomicrobiaceae bacterium]
MIRALLLWLVLALPAAAQSLPDWEYTSINDFARLLDNDDTRVIDQALIVLHADTGVEGTVVTIRDRRAHGDETALEPFATRLFNYWGVGDKRRNDGFMVLVLPDNREARIELGAGYPADFDTTAQGIMDDVMLPQFRNGDYSTGLRRGTLAVIEKIARPHAAGRLPPPPPPPPPPSWIERNVMTFVGIIMAAIASLPLSLFALFRWVNGRCPKCHNRDLVEISEPIRQEMSNNSWSISQQSVKRLCQKCGWSTTSIRSLPYTDTYAEDGTFLSRTRHYSSSSDSHSSSSSFSGGSSSGGGASGRW